MLSPPFVMYADIESLLIPPEEESDTILQTHVPWAVGSYLVPHEDLNYPQQPVVFHQGRSCVQEFCKYLDHQAREIYEYNKIHCNKPQLRTPMEELLFNVATECEYCKDSFDKVQK